MKKQMVVFLGIALWFAGAATLGLHATQEKTPPPSPEQPRRSAEAGERMFGTIDSVGVDRLQVKKMDGTSQTVMVDDQTKYRQGEKDVQLEDFKPGDRVAIRGKTNANQEFVALSVRRFTEEEAQRFQNAGERAFGEIVSIDKNQIKVRGRQGERTIVVNDQTGFMKEGQAISLTDLKVGDRIFAEGKETQGQFVATRIFTGQFRGPRSPTPQP